MSLLEAIRSVRSKSAQSARDELLEIVKRRAKPKAGDVEKLVNLTHEANVDIDRLDEIVGDLDQIPVWDATIAKSQERYEEMKRTLPGLTAERDKAKALFQELDRKVGSINASLGPTASTISQTQAMKQRAEERVAAWLAGKLLPLTLRDEYSRRGVNLF